MVSRGNGHKLEHGRLPLITRQHFCAAWETEHRHRLPREVAEIPLEISKSLLVVVPGTLCCVAVLEQLKQVAS